MDSRYTRPFCLSSHLLDIALDALLAAEREAIVLWLIEGYRKYKTEGLTVPAQIAEASSEYRQNSDITQWFFNENVNDLRDSQPDEKTKFEDFYDRYAAWCKQKNEKEKLRRRAYGHLSLARVFGHVRQEGPAVHGARCDPH